MSLAGDAQLSFYKDIMSKLRVFPLQSRWFRPAARNIHTRSFPALFVRGGTSNGLVVDAAALPINNLEWTTILAPAMGSPDPFGRQLDGMGSGISSTSKICVISRSERCDADVDFTFVQVGVKDGILDQAGNCGNMSSVVGPVAFDLGWCKDAAAVRAGTATMRIFNTNTSKMINSEFSTFGEPPAFNPDGDYAIDGVSGAGSRITLSFMDPGGAKTGKVLPTGNPIDVLKLADGSTVRASLVDVGNPGVFVRVDDVGLENFADTSPASIEGDSELCAKLEAIRQDGAARMGLDPTVESVPKIVLLFPELPSSDDQVDLKCQAMSMGQPHKAVPLTLALCLGAAARIPGTLAAQLASKKTWLREGIITIGHPSGRVDVGVRIVDGRIVAAQLYRTARVLMKGQVYY